MKIRTGFVSNSSSSSFVCNICYNADTLYDGGLSEIGMCECQNGHVICLEHLLFEAEPDDDNYVTSDACPLCQLKNVTDWMFKQYILKRMKLDEKAILKDINETFSTYKKFEKFCQPK